MYGLKSFRSESGVAKPNVYWKRSGRKRCSCGHRIRGLNHEQGDAHKRGKGSGRTKKW